MYRNNDGDTLLARGTSLNVRIRRQDLTSIALVKRPQFTFSLCIVGSVRDKLCTFDYKHEISHTYSF